MTCAHDEYGAQSDSALGSKADEPFSIEAEGGTVRLYGEIDLATAPKLAVVLRTLGGGDVVIDMAEVTFIDAAGLTVLVEAKRRRNGAGTMIIGSASPFVRRVFEITGLEELFSSPM